METGCNKTCQSCDYDFFEIVNIKEHEPVRIEKMLTRSLSVIILNLKKVSCKNMMNLFIQKINHIIAQFVSLVFLEYILERYDVFKLGFSDFIWI